MKTEREKIIKKLMHNPELTFNKLWEKEGTSNSFAYHLKVLEEDNLVQKTEKGYSLTHEGKKYATYIEGESGKQGKFPLLSVIIVVFNEKEDQVLMMKRTKEPFFGYWGFIGGKIKFDQYVLECASEELKEETGLEADLELKGLLSCKTYNNDSLSYNHQMLIVKAANPKGKLIEKTREGFNKWFKISEVKDLKIFPNIPYGIEIALNPSFKWVEADRFQKDDKFVDIKILKNKVL